MKIKQDDRKDEFKRIEHLLYGYNYKVWFNLYGPGDTEHSLEQVMRDLVSKDCILSGVAPTSARDAKKEIMGMVLSGGDDTFGPIDIESKSDEITELIDSVLSDIYFTESTLIVEFGFKEGHPNYPVYWDFAYDIHAQDKRWLFVGSSSD